MAYTVDQLGATEREWVWQANEPIFPALYCWHDGCWWYTTKDAPYWRDSTAKSGEVRCDGGFTAKAWMIDAIFEFGRPAVGAEL